MRIKYPVTVLHQSALPESFRENIIFLDSIAVHKWQTWKIGGIISDHIEYRNTF